MPQSDIYALGATLFYLLVAQDPVPVSVSSPAAHIEVGSSLDTIIRKATALDTTRRYASVADLAAELKTA